MNIQLETGRSIRKIQEAAEEVRTGRKCMSSVKVKSARTSKDNPDPAGYSQLGQYISWEVKKTKSSISKFSRRGYLIRYLAASRLCQKSSLLSCLQINLLHVFFSWGCIFDLGEVYLKFLN